MRQAMIDMMAMMMPFMKPVAIAGAVLGLIGIVAALAGAGARGGWAGTASRLAVAAGVFFVACEVAGRILGMEPTLLFASDPFDRALYRNQWPFWTVGLALAALGLASRGLASYARD